MYLHLAVRSHLYWGREAVLFRCFERGWEQEGGREQASLIVLVVLEHLTEVGLVWEHWSALRLRWAPRESKRHWPLRRWLSAS